MEFNQLLKQIDVILTDRQLEQFKIYFEFLVEYNNYVNLTAITSRSTHNLAWKYYFYCEAEGSLYSENIQKMIEILKNKCETFKIIGSY